MQKQSDAHGPLNGIPCNIYNKHIKSTWGRADCYPEDHPEVKVHVQHYRSALAKAAQSDIRPGIFRRVHSAQSAAPNWILVSEPGFSVFLYKIHLKNMFYIKKRVGNGLNR